MATEVEEVTRWTLLGAGEGVVATVRNKVWDTVAGGWVFWITTDPDSAGASYPGPGTWGVDTSNYRAEMNIYTEV